jgi:hypothetical protein
MMAAAVEALIGAVFKDIDLDLKVVCAVMGNHGFFTHPLLSRINCSFLTGHAGTTLQG